MNKPNNVVKVTTTVGEFFKYWFMFLKPFHGLTEKEIEVASALVRHRYELSKVIKDDNILDKVVMNKDTRTEIIKECKVSLPYYQVIMGKLKRVNIIKDEKLNPKFMPNIPEDLEGKDPESFQLLLYFDMKK